MADTATATPPESGLKRPEKPDENKYKSDLDAAEKAHQAAQAEFNAARAKLDGARGGGKGTPGDRWSELVAEQKEIRAKQGTHKSSRQTQQDKIDANDREMKRLIQEQKDGKARLGFKSNAEVEQRIIFLMKQAEDAVMTVADQKKCIDQATNLRRQLKTVDLDKSQQRIDTLKAENAELRKTFDNAEAKALSEKYEANQKELDQIKASREEVNKNYDKLKAEREQLYEKQQGLWKAMQSLKDNYRDQRREYRDYENQVYAQRRERQKAEREQFEKDKRKKAAEARLEEASTLAYSDEIITAEGIIRHFDPDYGTAEGDKGPSKYAASAQREVDASGFKGMSVMKKEEEDFFVGAGGKKKGKGGKKAATADRNFNLSIDIIQGLSKLGVDTPNNQSEVPATIEKLKEKVTDWKSNQKAQTEKNIEKAKKEIEKLEQEAIEASATPPKPRQRNNRSNKVNQKDAGIDDSAREVNVDAEQVHEDEKDGVADAIKDLEDAKIEDAETKDIPSA